MDWTSLLGVVLGGGMTLAGQAVQGIIARRAEIRHRTDEAAFSARVEILEVQDLYDKLRRPDAVLMPEDDAHLVRRLQKLRAAITLIADATVRQRITFVADALSHPTAIRSFDGDSQLTSGRYLCWWGDEVLGAHLRRERQPKEPGKINAYRAAIDEADRIAERHYRELESERLSDSRPRDEEGRP